MAAKYAHGVFTKFSSERYEFARTLASMTEKADTFGEHLLAEGGDYHLRALMHDRDSDATRVTATNALSQLVAFCGPKKAAELVSTGLLEDCRVEFERGVPALTKACAALVKAVASHSPELAEACLTGGMVAPLTAALREMDPSLREAAASTLQVLAAPSTAHATVVATDSTDSSHVLPLLVACLREPELSLKRTAAAALCEVAKHDEQLATAVVGAGTLPLVIGLLGHADTKLRRQASKTLEAVVCHSEALTASALSAGLLSRVLGGLQDNDAAVRRNAVVILRDVCKHSEANAQVVADAGGLHSLVNFATADGISGSARLPAVTALGYCAAFSPELAAAVIAARGVHAAKQALLQDAEEHCRAAAAWALGHMGRHSEQHATALAEADAFRHLCEVIVTAEGDDLPAKAGRCLSLVLPRCEHVPSMQALLNDATPRDVLGTVLKRIAAVLLTSDPTNEHKKGFVVCGGLKQVQSLSGLDKDGDLAALVEGVTAIFPAEVVAYYRPGYATWVLAERIVSDSSSEPLPGN